MPRDGLLSKDGVVTKTLALGLFAVVAARMCLVALSEKGVNGLTWPVVGRRNRVEKGRSVS